MLSFGCAPFLECSSKGDRRFSAFYAKIQSLGNRSIEDLYQHKKVFADGTTGLGWRAAKGKTPINGTECRVFYTWLWTQYFDENPALYAVLQKYNGFTDVFGQAGHCCQAEEIFRIKNLLH